MKDGMVEMEMGDELRELREKQRELKANGAAAAFENESELGLNMLAEDDEGEDKDTN